MVRATSRRELIRKLRRLGFNGPYPGKRHQMMYRGDLKLAIPNPHGEDIPAAVVSRLLREAGISEEDWERA